MSDGVKGTDKKVVEKIVDTILRSVLGSDPEKTLAEQQIGFEETGNPMTPWFALLYARNHSVPVPEWVLQYFTERAEIITDIVHVHESNKRNQQTNNRKNRKSLREAEAIGRALGFGAVGRGQKTPAATSAAQAEGFKFAFGVQIEMKLGANEGTAIINTADRCGWSESKVRRAHKSHKQQAKQAFLELLDVFEIS